MNTISAAIGTIGVLTMLVAIQIKNNKKFIAISLTGLLLALTGLLLSTKPWEHITIP